MASYKTDKAPIMLPDMWGQTAVVQHGGSSGAINGISQANGNVTLYAFNFTPDGLPDAQTFHPPQSGNVHLHFKLNASAGHAITILLYAEFENVMEIDNKNGVLYNNES